MHFQRNIFERTRIFLIKYIHCRPKTTFISIFGVRVLSIFLDIQISSQQRILDSNKLLMKYFNYKNRFYVVILWLVDRSKICSPYITCFKKIFNTIIVNLFSTLFSEFQKVTLLLFIDKAIPFLTSIIQQVETNSASITKIYSLP